MSQDESQSVFRSLSPNLQRVAAGGKDAVTPKVGRRVAARRIADGASGAAAGGPEVSRAGGREQVQDTSAGAVTAPDWAERVRRIREATRTIRSRSSDWLDD